MLRRVVLPSALIAGAMGILVSTACGILSAPISVPEAIAANHNAHLEGTITDGTGSALGDVTLTVQKGHTYWDAAAGQRTDFENSTALVSGKFSISRRGSTRVRLIFTKPGYVPALIEFDDQHLYLTAAATTEPGAPDAQKVPDTRPAYNNNPIGATVFVYPGKNAFLVDPSWKPGEAIRIILYPAQAATAPASAP